MKSFLIAKARMETVLVSAFEIGRIRKMAEKRYYWLKLNRGFFGQKEIKRLRRLAGGDTYTIIYLKMLLRSLDHNGVLFYEGIEDDFIEELALDIDEKEDDVAVTVQYLQSKGLLIEVSEEEYLLTECERMTGSESASAERVRKHRDNSKSLHCNEGALHHVTHSISCNTNVTNCNTEKEKEIDKDIEKSKKKNKSKKEDTLHLFDKLCSDYIFDDIVKDKLVEWITYKQERKEGYQEQGMKTLLRRIENSCMHYGGKAVCDLIDDSMSNGWKGIIFDRLQKDTAKKAAKSSDSYIDMWRNA